MHTLHLNPCFSQSRIGEDLVLFRGKTAWNQCSHRPGEKQQLRCVDEYECVVIKSHLIKVSFSVVIFKQTFYVVTLFSPTPLVHGFPHGDRGRKTIPLWLGTEPRTPQSLPEHGPYQPLVPTVKKVLNSRHSNGEKFILLPDKPLPERFISSWHSPEKSHSKTFLS